MIYLVLSIVLTSSLILFFKLFDKYKVNTLQAIVVNYFTASALGFLFSSNENGLSTILHADWLLLAIPLGFLFISIFYAISVATVKIGVSATTVANKMSLIIPVSLAFFLYDDKITIQKIAGIVLALIAVVLTSKKENNSETSAPAANLFTLSAIVFFGSGLIDTLVKYVQDTHLKGNNSDLFLGTTFFIAGIIGSLFIVIQLLKKKATFERRSILWGIALGIPNYFSIYTLIKALDTGRFESSVFYPINNIGIVVLSAIAAYFLFKEKLSKINLLGIVIAFVSIILISL